MRIPQLQYAIGLLSMIFSGCSVPDDAEGRVNPVEDVQIEGIPEQPNDDGNASKQGSVGYVTGGHLHGDEAARR